jgi:KDO2-lipid IV(A) lauroyltransferase
MAPARKRVVRRIAALGSILFLALTRVLPLDLSRFLTRALGRAAARVVPRVKDVGLANLDLAYGNSLSREEKLRVLRGAVDNVACVAAEFSRLPWLSRRGYEGYVEIRGEEHLDFSQGVLFFGGHLGNWEMMASVIAARGHRVAEIVRPLDDPWLNHAVDSTRRRAGILTIPKDNAAREALRLLNEGWLVGVLIDQSPRATAVPADFFGQPCWTTIAVALIASRAKIPAHLVSMFREPGGCYVLEFHPRVEMDRTGHLRQDLLVNTQRCQQAFEQLVRQHPEQWLWLHRRWKKHPRLEAEWQARQEKV